MKIRLLSDLHIDVNESYPLDLRNGEFDDIFTLVAGDICGSPHNIVKWIKHNITQGGFISGNHDVYDTDMEIEDIKQYLSNEFPIYSNVTYFDNEVGVISKEIDENTLLVADVLYTDYEFKACYYCNDIVKFNIDSADPWRSTFRGGLNDFNYGKCKRIWPNLNDCSTMRPHRLVPEYYLEHFNKAFDEITKTIEANQDKDIILMTHHCLSPKCIADEYKGDNLNASYVSDKEQWIIDHPNIKFIFSGHIHARKSFKIGNATYAMNALGYCNSEYSKYDPTSRKYVNWTPDCILDTNDWSVNFIEHRMPSWESKYNSKRLENLNMILKIIE